jgi:RNA polymerase sigma-70 factor (ECF subfamily)
MGRATDDESHSARFRRLFADHQRAVLGYALRRAQTPADALDVVAETFLVAWRRIEVVPGPDDARPWLLSVARRVLANQRRGDERRHQLVQRLGDELALDAPLEQDRTADSEVVRHALAKLPEDDRELMQLTCWEGLDPAQIAVVLSIPPGTVRSRLSRARARLRVELADLGPEPGPPGRPLEHVMEDDR